MNPNEEAALLEGMTASAFLDDLGRFAKSEETVAIVRIYYGDADTYEELDIDEFDSLTEATRTAIKETGSAAGLVDTDGISNA